MNAKEKENYRAEIHKRLAEMDRTLAELRRKSALRGGGDSEFKKDIGEFEFLRMSLEDRLHHLDRSDHYDWENFRSDMDSFFKDIDNNLREALGYYK